MNRKVRGILLVILGIFFIYLLINKNNIQTDNNMPVVKTSLSIMLFLFGKMIHFISIFTVGLGLFYYFFGDVKLKFHKSKIVALIVWFLAWSMLLIKENIKEPYTDTFIESGRKILEIGFNKESGGLIGGLVSMPFYKIIHIDVLSTILKITIVISILVIFKEFLLLIYDLISGLIKYYLSDEYKKKRKILKAKKEKEKYEYINSQKNKREQLKERVVAARKQKLSFEISKKPKDSILEKDELYSESELIDKEKEWLQFMENQKTKIEDVGKIKEKGQSKISDIEPKNIREDIKTEQDKIIEKEDINKKLEDNKKIKGQNKILKPKDLQENEKNDILDIENGDYKEIIEKATEEIFKTRAMDPAMKKEIEKGIAENVKELEEVLKEFGIDAKVVKYEYGPTITRYEITIPRGIKVSKITSLSDDIQMNLAAKSIRIEAPIPGKNTIGIETPNKVKEPVYFSNIIRNPKLNDGALNVILGKNVIGEDKIIDIAKTPHLLIAGTTGSGKSVAINTLISTLITKKSEHEVKFIMVDPKMVELMPYNGIPHLLVPVIIDPRQAAIALKWAVNEMEHRYKLLSENGARNIIGFNKLGYVEKMPYIVVVIDELADLMMVAAGSVEESIARIAQKARAVGIHLILATQRPSTDVITGMIKANLPSRISFALKSQIDSRTILDSPGAEKLLGQGDMLLSENGSSVLERIQGAFISDEEVDKLTTALKKSKKVVYREEILIDTFENNKDVDPLFENAIDIIKQEGKASISMLQRKLSVGFNRASRIYEQLKNNGIIGDDNQLLIDDDE